MLIKLKWITLIISVQCSADTLKHNVCYCCGPTSPTTANALPNVSCLSRQDNVPRKEYFEIFTTWIGRNCSRFTGASLLHGGPSLKQAEHKGSAAVILCEPQRDTPWGSLSQPWWVWAVLVMWWGCSVRQVALIFYPGPSSMSLVQLFK